MGIGSKWFACPGRRNSRGGKMGGKLNILNENLLLSALNKFCFIEPNKWKCNK
jgi:hypothetical protein